MLSLSAWMRNGDGNGVPMERRPGAARAGRSRTPGAEPPVDHSATVICSSASWAWLRRSSDSGALPAASSAAA